jgi:diguanylate cyclase (GGDEF)-like protein
VVLLTVLGTAFCIVIALFLDSYSFQTGSWRWGTSPWNNVIIPLVLAPPFFFYLLGKLRELAIAHHDLMIVASTDVLTSCLNRRAFVTLVDAYLEKTAHLEGYPDKISGGALLVIDVDNFKAINDKFGHACGDEALAIIARTIKDGVRDVDLVGRIGGEEFSVFLPGLDPSRSGAVAERIRAAVNASDFFPTGQRCDLSVSVGGTTFERRASYGELFRFADQWLYVAKQSGRNRVEIHGAPTGDFNASIMVH